MAIVGTAEVEIRPETTKFSSQLESQLKGATAKAQGIGSKLGGVLGVGLLTAASGGIVAVSTEILHLADTWESAHARLETATKNVGENFDQFSGQVQKTDDKMANLGFGAADVESSLATLTTVTKNVQTAMGLEGLAADIAAGRHISLASATSILTKVETGHVALLGRLGIQTKDATGATISQQQAITELTTLYGGQAQAAANTFGGKIKALETNAENLGTKIGVAVIPVIETFVSDILAGVTWLGNVNAATDGWLGKLALLAVGLTVATIALGKLETVAAGIPLIGGFLSTLLGPIAIVAGAFEGLRLIVGHFDDSGLDSAATTAQLTAGLKQLGAQGTESYYVFTRFGDNFDKVVKAFRDAQHFTGGITNDIANFGEHLLGASSSADQAEAPIKNIQKALLELFKTDPTDAIAAFAKIKASLISQGVSAADVDKQFAKYEKTAGALGEVLAPLTAKQQQQAAAQQAALKALNSSLDKYGKEAGPLAEKIASSMHLTQAAVDALTASTKTMNDGIDKAFDNGAATIDKFTQSGKFNLASFEQSLLTDTIAAANWSKNIAILSDAGINHGFLQTLIDAGPKSAKVLQGLVDGISKGSVQSINAIESFATKASGQAKSTVDAQLLGLRGSFLNFATFIAGLHPNLDIRIAGQSASLVQFNNAALAARGGGQKFARGGIATGPSSGYGVTLHGTEAVLPLNDPARALSVLGDAAKYLGGGSRTAGVAPAPVQIVLAPVFPPGMDPATAMAEMKTFALGALADALEQIQTGHTIRTGTGR